MSESYKLIGMQEIGHQQQMQNAPADPNFVKIMAEVNKVKEAIINKLPVVYAAGTAPEKAIYNTAALTAQFTGNPAFQTLFSEAHIRDLLGRSVDLNAFKANFFTELKALDFNGAATGAPSPFGATGRVNLGADNFFNAANLTNFFGIAATDTSAQNNFLFSENNTQDEMNLYGAYKKPVVTLGTNPFVPTAPIQDGTHGTFLELIINLLGTLLGRDMSGFFEKNKTGVLATDNAAVVKEDINSTIDYYTKTSPGVDALEAAMAAVYDPAVNEDEIIQLALENPDQREFLKKLNEKYKDVRIPIATPNGFDASGNPRYTVTNREVTLGNMGFDFTRTTALATLKEVGQSIDVGGTLYSFDPTDAASYTNFRNSYLQQQVRLNSAEHISNNIDQIGNFLYEEAKKEYGRTNVAGWLSGATLPDVLDPDHPEANFEKILDKEFTVTVREGEKDYDVKVTLRKLGVTEYDDFSTLTHSNVTAEDALLEEFERRNKITSEFDKKSILLQYAPTDRRQKVNKLENAEDFIRAVNDKNSDAGKALRALKIPEDELKAYSQMLLDYGAKGAKLNEITLRSELGGDFVSKVASGHNNASDNQLASLLANIKDQQGKNNLMLLFSEYQSVGAYPAKMAKITERFKSDGRFADEIYAQFGEYMHNAYPEAITEETNRAVAEAHERKMTKVPEVKYSYAEYAKAVLNVRSIINNNQNGAFANDLRRQCKSPVELHVLNTLLESNQYDLNSRKKNNGGDVWIPPQRTLRSNSSRRNVTSSQNGMDELQDDMNHLTWKVFKNMDNVQDIGFKSHGLFDRDNFDYDARKLEDNFSNIYVDQNFYENTLLKGEGASYNRDSIGDGQLRMARDLKFKKRDIRKASDEIDNVSGKSLEKMTNLRKGEGEEKELIADLRNTIEDFGKRQDPKVNYYTKDVAEKINELEVLLKRKVGNQINDQAIAEKINEIKGLSDIIGNQDLVSKINDIYEERGGVLTTPAENELIKELGKIISGNYKIDGKINSADGITDDQIDITNGLGQKVSMKESEAERVVINRFIDITEILNNGSGDQLKSAEFLEELALLKNNLAQLSESDEGRFTDANNDFLKLLRKNGLER